MKKKWADAVAIVLAVTILAGIWLVGTYRPLSYSLPFSAEEVEQVTLYVSAGWGLARSKTTDRDAIASVHHTINTVKVQRDRPHQMVSVDGSAQFLLDFRLTGGREYRCGGLDNGLYPNGEDQNLFYTSDGWNAVVSGFWRNELEKRIGNRVTLTDDRAILEEFDDLWFKLFEENAAKKKSGFALLLS